ncbi:unnamed protein product [Penicillium salamii]|nr:unnamed protein product [Penicillium salamii]
MLLPGFCMPTLNSIFPFLDDFCPKSDPSWHIRRGRLLHHYSSIWVAFRDETSPQAMTFDCEPQFGSVETMKDSRFMLCLIPNSWIVTIGTRLAFLRSCKLREFCSLLISIKPLGLIFQRDEFRSFFEE